MRLNLLVNVLGQLWRGLMLVAFVPIYVKILGVEAYGLIGILAVVQVGLTLFDIGLRPALSREMARFVGGGYKPDEIWDLLRSVECIALGISLVLGTLFLVSSAWLAVHWVNPADLPTHVVSRAFALMGVVAGLQLLESVYLSALIGLQRHVLQNLIAAAAVSVRGIGSVALLLWVSPTISAFFIWQATVSLLSAVAFAVIVYKILPWIPRAPQFSRQALSGIKSYALGMIGISFLILVLTQFDKLLLSHALPLKEYGYYMLASAVAGVLSMASTPVGTVYYPRMIELIERRELGSVTATFHQGAQLLSVTVGAAAVLIAVFSSPLLALWTGDVSLASKAGPILSLLVLGAGANSIASIPYLLQLSFGSTSIATRINLGACICLVPLLLLVTPRYGGFGAAAVLLAINLGCLAASGVLTFRSLLVGERVRWALLDVMAPLAAIAAVGFVARATMPADLDWIDQLFFLMGSALFTLTAGAFATPAGREYLAKTGVAFMRRLAKPPGKG